MFSIFKRDPLKAFQNDLAALETLFTNLSLDFQYSDVLGSKQRHSYGAMGVTFLSMTRSPYKLHESFVLRENNVWLGTLSRVRHDGRTTFSFTLPGQASRSSELRTLITGFKQVLVADNRLRSLDIAA
jgi:hypothetical protein